MAIWMGWVTKSSKPSPTERTSGGCLPAWGDTHGFLDLGCLLPLLTEHALKGWTLKAPANNWKILFNPFTSVHSLVSFLNDLGFMRVFAAIFIELMDVFNWFFAFFLTQEIHCFTALFFRVTCYFLWCLPCWWKFSFGFSSRFWLEWMLRFIDNFQLFHSNEKFIKRTWFCRMTHCSSCCPAKEFAIDFFPMILLAIVFLFWQSLHATLSSCDSQ